jgi:hypothetical protein
MTGSLTLLRDHPREIARLSCERCGRTARKLTGTLNRPAKRTAATKAR